MGDGLSDWPDTAIKYAIPYTLHISEKWDGTDDLTTDFQIGYDNQFLYLAVTVRDDIHIQNRSDKWIGKGEVVELLIDVNRIEDISGGVSNDDFQILLSPGNSDFSARITNFVRQGNQWGELEDIGEVSDIQMGAIQLGNGYQLEAGIPWSLLNITPQSGTLMGISIGVNDSDARDGSQIVFKSTNWTRGLTDPNSWGEIWLE